MRDFLRILGKSIGWASALTILVFILSFNWALSVGGSQTPLVSAVLAPITFFLVLTIVMLTQFRRAVQLSPGAKLAYFVFLAFFLIHSVHDVPVLWKTVFAISSQSVDAKKITREERLKHTPPLTQDEHLLLQSTHFNARVGVVNPRFPPAYTRGLIEDLERTGLFDEVAELEQMDRADYIATIKGRYYGDKNGQNFSLQQPEGPTKEIEINVYYTLGGSKSFVKDTKQYRARLSVETINAVQALSNHD